MDLSNNILIAVTGYSWDEKPITWDWTDCGGGSSSTASTSSTPSSSSTPAAASTPVVAAPVVSPSPPPPYVRPSCPFADGTVVRCPSTGDVFE